MIKLNNPCLPAALLCSATLFSIPVPLALAQENLALEEVLVTARRRVESLQDAPLAVTALTGEALLDAGISNLADITEIVPNLQVSRPARDANIYIRGVGPSRGATNVTELSVGVYIDDVFLLKPHGQLMDLAEVESVQVLRGPQGTLFGKNTTGGRCWLPRSSRRKNWAVMARSPSAMMTGSIFRLPWTCHSTTSY